MIELEEAINIAKKFLQAEALPTGLILEDTKRVNGYWKIKVNLIINKYEITIDPNGKVVECKLIKPETPST